MSGGGVSSQSSQRDPFKFPLQEEKFNSIRRLSNLNMNGEINKLISKGERDRERERDSKSVYNFEQGNHIVNTDLNHSISNQSSYFEKNNEYLNIKTLDRGENDIAKYISPYLKGILIYTNELWYLNDKRDNLWRHINEPLTTIITTITYYHDNTL